MLICDEIRLFQSTHSAWEWDYPARIIPVEISISIHPLRVGVGLLQNGGAGLRYYFNPPTPRGSGTTATTVEANRYGISIHPLRVGVGLDFQFGCGIWIHFNPPTPRGSGTVKGYYIVDGDLFQSTHSAWEWDTGRRQRRHGRSDFNPPTPRGSGTAKVHRFYIVP